MSFDKPTRNKLASMVGECRRLLTEDIRHQLQAIYGLQPDGDALAVSTLGHLDEQGREAADELRAWQAHLASTEIGTEQQRRKEAFNRVARETAFTALNRLAALRMCEERGHVIECVRRGMESDGFLLYERFSSGVLGDRGATYRIFLERMFDELAADLGALFDRRAPQSLVFPRERCLEEVLTLLNAPELAHLWKEDEAIGWIYQYFNSKEEREAMRDASSAPRNSRELAVRNQFFTPRYVVEFLVDNTLGRTWYEMRQGSTVLRETCQYLVRRPTEIFLSEVQEAPPAQDTEEAGLSQEQLLKQPVYIAHRAKKDPRDLKILDPACGSGHFLLYCFDLLETIYEEAWTQEKPPASNVTGGSLRHDFPELARLKREIPALIIRHNLHGIDIDLRACQIAALVLWLRAQRSYQRMELKAAERPRITRSNIVCAEPMPGEPEMLEQFVADLRPNVIGQLVRVVFEKMKLAGEAGSLLKIEEEIRDAVAEAKKQWLTGPKPEQQLLFGEIPRPQQTELAFDLSGITDAFVWERAEELIYQALERYAEQAEDGHGYQRRLFSDDARRGFGFIDLCRQHYDIVLMNPPFGDASVPSKPYIEETYGDTKGDVYKAFVECFQVRLVVAGYLGIISSRAGFFLGQSEDWRTRVILRLFRPIVLADLGSGVLDAMVEVAAYVLRALSEDESKHLTLSLIPSLRNIELDTQGRFSLPKWQAVRELKRHQALAELELLIKEGFVEYSARHLRFAAVNERVLQAPMPRVMKYPRFTCLRVLGRGDKSAAILRILNDATDRRAFSSDPAEFSLIPGSPFTYWISNHARKVFSSFPRLDADGREVVIGASTKDDFRFLRLTVEIPSTEKAAISAAGLVACGQWIPFAKGGRAQAFYADLHLAINWCRNGEELKALISEYRGSRGWGYQWSAELKPRSFSFRPGLTWGRRSTSLEFKVLPRNCMFADKGPAILTPSNNADALLALLAIVSSKAFRFLVSAQLARVELAQSFEIGLIQQTPVPPINVETEKQLRGLAFLGWAKQRSVDATELTSHSYYLPSVLRTGGTTLAERARAWENCAIKAIEQLRAIQSNISTFSLELYGLADQDITLESLDDANVPPLEEDEEPVIGTTNTVRAVGELVEHALGLVFGRWDIGFATGQKLPPEPSDPFAPLPVCPPGQLQNEHGLPLTPEDVQRLQSAGQWNYPLDIPWDGLLVDDEDNKADDVIGRLRKVLLIIWKDRAEAIEQEACEILEVTNLKEYLRKPSLFFADHLKRYSKSRRQAPIYWPLSTASGSYTLWVYYHRFNDDTLYTALNKFVKPKIDATEKQLARFESDLPNKSGREASNLRESVEQTKQLLDELHEFRNELERVAALPYRPNLNDGVLITAAPLWKLFRLPKWRKDLQECWKKLEAGEYDWAHLAYSIWPDRVREVCKHDRSIAIAHNLEDLCEVVVKPAKKKRSKKAVNIAAPNLAQEETVRGDKE